MRHRMGAMMLAVALLLGLVAIAGGQGSSDYSQPAAANSAGTQLQTAITHAGNSARSAAMAGAVTHLGHVLNCIEGTGGKNFNASWGHVCQGQGNGIVNDIKGARNAEQVSLVLNAANELAVAGVKATDLATVQNAARGVGALLRVVLDATK